MVKNPLANAGDIRNAGSIPESGPPGSSVHGIFQVRALEWGAIEKKTQRKEIPTSFRKQQMCPLLEV